MATAANDVKRIHMLYQIQKEKEAKKAKRQAYRRKYLEAKKAREATGTQRHQVTPKEAGESGSYVLPPQTRRQPPVYEGLNSSDDELYVPE